MNGYLKIKTTVDNSGVEKQIEQLKNKINDLQAGIQIAKEKGGLLSKSEILDDEVKVEKLTSSLKKLEAKQQEIDDKNWKKIASSINEANKGITKTIKSVGRWALGIFAIESAYGFVTSMINTISNENEQIATDIDYMKSAIASSLKPLVESLVALAFKLLSYVNAISTAWFGVNLFANASVDSFKKAEKSASNMKKSLAGFDEMNIVTDTSVSQGGTNISPSYDLSKMQAETPAWLRFIIDNKDEILSLIAGLITGITLVKLGLDGIKATGIGLIVSGLILSVKGLIDYLNDPSWQNFLTIIQGISLVIAGISLLTGNWMVAVIALGTAIVTYLIKNWDTVKGILGTVGQWIYSKVIEPIGNFFVGLFNGIVGVFGDIGNFFKNVFKGAYDGIVSIFNNIPSFFSGIYNSIIGIFKSIGTKVGSVVGSAFKTALNGALSTIEKVLNTPINAINGLLSIINKVPGINIGKLNTIKLPRLASGGIVNNPGHGVAMSGYIAGESGREGVIPLTDPYAMQTLGREIGKWITVNNTSNTYLDGRLIQRNQEKVKEELAFATNGGM